MLYKFGSKAFSENLKNLPKFFLKKSVKLNGNLYYFSFHEFFSPFVTLNSSNALMMIFVIK